MLVFCVSSLQCHGLVCKCDCGIHLPLSIAPRMILVNSKLYHKLLKNRPFHDCTNLSDCNGSFNGPRHRKTCLQGFANDKEADQPAQLRRLISAIVICFLEIIISKLATSEISIF